jgi:hypothetical protein
MAKLVVRCIKLQPWHVYIWSDVSSASQHYVFPLFDTLATYLPKILGRFLCTHHWQLMKLVGGRGSWSLLFMMEVLVWNFMSDTHEVMTAFILIVLVSVSLYLTVQLYSKCCCGVLSAISVMWFFCIVLIINQSCSFPKTNWVYVLPLFAKCMQL